MRREDRHSFRANWLLRTWQEQEQAGVSQDRRFPIPFEALPALILTSEGCPAPTTISLPSSKPTSTWLRSLVTATLRMGTFMGRGGAAGSSLEGGRGDIYIRTRNYKEALIQQIDVSPFSHLPPSPHLKDDSIKILTQKGTSHKCVAKGGPGQEHPIGGWEDR